MASDSRFTSQNKTTQQRISNNTVGLVALSDFRKRRAEVLEQQEREAREAALSGSPTSTPTPDRSLTSTPDPASDPAVAPKKKKKKRNVGVKLSFGNDEDENEGGSEVDKGATDARNVTPGKDEGTPADRDTSKAESALRREAAERDILRREFLQRQERVKAAEIAIPFVFYDGSNIPGGTVRVRKGDFVWQFLDKSRKVGADLGVGEKANARREWARVGVDDLMMVRGNVIIPHHYDFLFFIMNKTLGPNGSILFKYDAEASIPPKYAAASDDQPPPINTPLSATSTQVLIETLEGASDDPTMTRVVDRRWYERNKHIYPASMWQDFDPEKDYQKEVRRDPGGNTFFYS
ncbi:hypothetical protein RRF57_009756 [Xylaria bambusicola]|uniref:FAM50A/XAP5 C-terminal domain-containing protein n=1 Tax=Xylaria bambusicola TaxID=326684 RepID=A0AAN7Z958_9PEZI